MRKNIEKIVAVSLSALLTAGLITGNVEYASHCFAMNHTVVQTAAAQNIRKTDNTADSDSVSKQETVYVTMDASGRKTDVIVSDWLKNAGIGENLEDSSVLTDIVNVKGEEEFTRDGSRITWEAGDNDIYYQGRTDSELPVGLEIKYYLDGEEKKPEEIAGQSGNIRIQIKYKNDSSQSKQIAGQDVDIYTPFVMATGMILPVENFRNITIDNGTVLSEGENTIIVGYGMPGLAESLDLDSLDLDSRALDNIRDKITDTVTITADVTDFEMSPTYTIATSSLFNELNLDEAEETDDLSDKIDELTDSATELVNGTKELQDGVSTLKNSFTAYRKAVGKVTDGAGDLQSGSAELKNGVNTYTKGTNKLLGGVGDYVKGAGSLSEGVISYTGGTKKLVDAIGTLHDATADLPEQYKTFGDGVNTFVVSVNTLLSEDNMTSLTNGAASLKAGVAELDDALVQSAAGVKTIHDSVSRLEKTEEMENCVSGLDQMLAQYTELAGQAAASGDHTTARQYESMAEALTGAIQYIEGAEQTAAGIAAATNGVADGEADKNGAADLSLALAQMQQATSEESQTANLYTGAAAMESSVNTIASSAKQLRDSSSQLTAGNQQMSDGLSSLSGSVTTMKNSAETLTKNNKTLNDGAKSLVKNGKKIKKNSKKLTGSSSKLQNGAKTLAKGADTLYNGMKELMDATVEVEGGISDVHDGTETLQDGMQEFDSRGIQKIADTIRGLLDSTEEFSDRLTAISDASDDYRSFSGISDDMEGSVKFIFSTEEIAADEEEQ